MTYLKQSSLDGVKDEDEVVDERFVERYAGSDTVGWFRGLGGTENVVRHGDGTIAVTSVSPDGDHRRVTVFTPTTREVTR